MSTYQKELPSLSSPSKSRPLSFSRIGLYRVVFTNQLIKGGLCAEEAVYHFGIIGTTWTCEEDRFERTNEAIETVTVPGRTFGDYIRVRQKDRICEPSADDILECFYLGGWGTVNEIRYWKECGTVTPRITTDVISYAGQNGQDLRYSPLPSLGTLLLQAL